VPTDGTWVGITGALVVVAAADEVDTAADELVDVTAAELEEDELDDVVVTAAELVVLLDVIVELELVELGIVQIEEDL